MNQAKSTILIVEDDLDIAEMLNAYFRVQGYTVVTANWGEDGVRSCLTCKPDLVILDIRLPDMDGFKVAECLRSNRQTKDIPIIFLTEKRERQDRLKGLELKADDYVTKPFDIQELRLKVRNALQRSQQGSLTHPITGLPQGSMVDDALKMGFDHPESAVMVVAINNLSRFREVYGFVASDDLLRATSLMIQDAVSEIGDHEDFLGHITASDFVIVTRRSLVHPLRDRIRRRLEQSFDYFYSDQDRELGTFRNKQLGVQINELSYNLFPQHDLSHLKAELKQFCH